MVAAYAGPQKYDLYDSDYDRYYQGNDLGLNIDCDALTDDESVEILKERIFSLMDDLNMTWNDVNAEYMKMYKKNWQKLDLIEMKGLEKRLSAELAARRIEK